MNFKYEIEEIQQIDDQTVKATVLFNNDDVPYHDCCILRKEDNKWRINLNYAYAGDDRLSLIDYRNLEVESQEKPGPGGVEIKPLRVIRWTNKLVLVFSIKNFQGRCVHWGAADNIRAIFKFSDQQEYSRGEVTLDPEENLSGAFVAIDGFYKTYPTSIELRDWLWSDETLGCDVPDKFGEKWSYPFELRYSP